MKKFIVLGLDGAVPPIIEQGMRERRLPNFHRLMTKGVYAHNIPFPSAVTPGNWAAIATGARPVATGISDFSVHKPGEPLDQWHLPFRRELCLAETLWESLSRQKKRCATIGFPTGYPRSGSHHLSIGDDGAPLENNKLYALAPARLLVAGDLDPCGPYEWREYECVQLTKPGNWAELPTDMIPVAEFGFAVKAVNREHGGEIPCYALICERAGELRVLVASTRCYGNKLAEIRQGKWSQWLEKKFVEGDAAIRCSFRFRLVKVDTEKVQLYLSSLYPVERFSDPPEISTVLAGKLGPYHDSLKISALLNNWIDDEGMMDELRLQGLWQARAAVTLLREHECAGVFTKWHAFDKFYHFFFDRIDPVSPYFAPETFERFEAFHQSILRAADEMVGTVLDAMDDETTLIVMSDHGLQASARHVNVNNFLAREGYLTASFDEEGKPIIDWSRTRAILAPFVQIWINLKGRDPQGIVEPGADYKELCDEIIEKLRGWRDPKTGGHILAEVFHISDGACYGLGGPRDGDIRLHTVPGYSLYRHNQPTADGKLVMPPARPYLGDHGNSRPTADFGRGSEYAIFFACGRHIRACGRRLQPISPCDVVPTLCEIIGVPPPRNSAGAVLRDIL